MTGLRILITGSRAWWDRPAVHQAIIDAIGTYGPADLYSEYPSLGTVIDWSRVTVVHGDCPRGADRIASRLARAWRMGEEPHPADWARYGRRAGPVRNTAMVAAGADVCLAFPLGASPGTRGCMALATKAGIPVIVHQPAETGARP